MIVIAALETAKREREKEGRGQKKRREKRRSLALYSP